MGADVLQVVPSAHAQTGGGGSLPASVADGVVTGLDFFNQPDPPTGSLVVTTADDVVDANDGLTSLREALAFANNPAAGDLGDGDADNDGNANDTITFDPSLSGSTITLALGTLALTSDVTIDGDLNDDGVSDITVDGDDAVAVFTVSGGSSAFEGLTITGGYTDDTASGAGIAVFGGASLALTDSAVTGNNAGYFGGGIFVGSGSSLLAADSTISGNTSAFGSGGGVYSAGSLTLLNTTVSDNQASGAGGGLYARRRRGTARRVSIVAAKAARVLP